MPTRRISYKFWVHTVPESQGAPETERDPDPDWTPRIYRRVVASNLLWPVWMIDEFGQHWILVDFRNEEGEFEHHSIVIPDEIAERVPTPEPYEVISNETGSVKSTNE